MAKPEQAGKKEGGLGEGIFARLLSAEGGMGWESVSAIPTSAGKQNRKIFVSLIEKILARGRLKNVKKIFLFCLPSGERKRWAGQSAKSSGFCSKKVLTLSNKHHSFYFFNFNLNFMVEIYASQPEALEDLKEGYIILLKQGDPDRSSHPFVRDVRRTDLNKSEKRKLTPIGNVILWASRMCGFGYLSSSSGNDRLKELKAVLYIWQCFREKTDPRVEPVIVPIDDFYKFIPGILSLVGKTRVFNEVAKKNESRRIFCLILTGFSDSKIFTEEVLRLVPNQDNAGLNISRKDDFGNILLDFSQNLLPGLVKKYGGNLEAVLKEIIDSGRSSEEDAKLLLVTALLLQDIQMWQKLWYESKGEGAPLYIVAPKYFHDAMNRLNLNWGNGSIDYNYRTSNSLGAFEKPPLEDEVELENYYEQGLSAEEFRRRIGPILEKLRSKNLNG